MAEHFDHDMVSRNWGLVAVPEPDRLAGPLAAVQAPLDPFVAARGELTQIRALIGREAPDHALTLDPFLRRAEQAVARLDEELRQESLALAAVREAADRGGEGSPPPAPPPAETAPLREELQAALADLEDLLEVFLFVSRKGG
jgi:hypothetical protein